MIPQCRKNKVKTVLKRYLSNSKLKTSKVDSLLWLDYLMFLRRLATEAHLNAAENKQKMVTAAHVKAVSKKVLQSCRG